MEDQKSNFETWGTGIGQNGGSSSSSFKTQLCKRFMQDACPLASTKCNYAHGVSDLRPRRNQQLCRLFSVNGQCSYGHHCRFLHHQQSNKNAPFLPHAQPQPQADAGGKLDDETCTASPTNASTSTVEATSPMHKNEEPYRVKFIFKENKLNKINGIYGDWI